MSWSSRGGFERRGYHHGNLREALVEAAMALIAEKGPAGFTIAEAARLAGVSPGAPYRHFRDAAELLAEVARRGFDHLAHVLSGAWNDGRPDPVRALEAVGRAYLGFARNQPAYYAAMFEARIDVTAHAGLSSSGDRAFGVLRDATARLAATLPRERRPPPLMMALHVWALAHGVASLFVRADPSRRKLPMSPEELLEAGVLLYLQSFGLAGGKP
jgi:AcrR family transcriptional regulator